MSTGTSSSVGNSNPSNTTAAPLTPQIARRNDAPGIPEANSNSSGEQQRMGLSAVPSSDHSSHSGSDSNPPVERKNPFEQPMLHPSGSHHSASPERNNNNNPQTAPSSPSHTASVTSAPRSPAPPYMPSVAAGNNNNNPAQQQQQYDAPPDSENDDFTHSSSAVNSTEPASSYTPSAEEQQQQSSGVANSLQRFLENTRKRLQPQMVNNSNNQASRNNSADDLIEDLDGMIIGGYLQKLGRNGKWQTRWFESDGECLSYYKNENRTKLLATLDLEKVSGGIRILIFVMEMALKVSFGLTPSRLSYYF